MVKALIIDDEMFARKRVRDLLEDYNTIEVVGECSNGKNAVREIENLQPDLVFIDMNMTDMTGLEVLDRVSLPASTLVIFVTAHENYALNAFDHEAFDFLLKPFDDERFHRTLEKALKHQNSSGKQLEALLEELVESKSRVKEKMLPIRKGNKTILLNTKKINYILASGSYAEIFTKEKKHVIREPLGKLMEALDEDTFYRVHRSAIINLYFIQEIHHRDYSEIDVQMKDNKLISVSKSQKKNFLKIIGS